MWHLVWGMVDAVLPWWLGAGHILTCVFMPVDVEVGDVFFPQPIMDAVFSPEGLALATYLRVCSCLLMCKLEMCFFPSLSWTQCSPLRAWLWLHTYVCVHACWCVSWRCVFSPAYHGRSVLPWGLGSGYILMCVHACWCITWRCVFVVVFS